MESFVLGLGKLASTRRWVNIFKYLSRAKKMEDLNQNNQIDSLIFFATVEQNF